MAEQAESSGAALQILLPAFLLRCQVAPRTLRPLLQLKQQLEGAMQEAEAALAALGETSPGAPLAAEQPLPVSQLHPGTAQAAVPAAGPAEREGAAAGPAPRPAGGAASQPRGVPARGNARIHPRSKYAFEEPDFAALAKLYPSLQPFLLPPRGGAPGGAAAAAAAAAEAAAGAPGSQAAGSGAARASLDFTDPAACRELTRVLLRHDFGLEWWVPLGQLVPPVTNRANYIHWLEDLLSLSAPKGEPAHAPARLLRMN